MAAANTDVSTTDAEKAVAALREDLNKRVSQEDLNISYGSYEEAIAAMELDGITDEEAVLVRSPFRVIDNKDELIGVPFVVRFVRFSVDEKSERPYAVLYCIARFPGGDEMVIVTDGSTGIYRQMLSAVEKRIKNKAKRPNEWWNVVNGLTKSEYDLTTQKDGKIVPAKPGDKVTGEATTYYIG